MFPIRMGKLWTSIRRKEVRTVSCDKRSGTALRTNALNIILSLLTITKVAALTQLSFALSLANHVQL